MELPGICAPSIQEICLTEAYDVYSIGVVMVELILGCVMGGQSTRNGMQFENVFRRYVMDEDDESIVDGWKVLIEQDADPATLWNRESLQQVGKAACDSVYVPPPRQG